jgi:regulator of cell morphogenesis and NO signaling
MTDTLGALAAAYPAAIPTFERFDLDYCCGGGRTLGAACAERGLSASEVLEAIGAGAGVAPAERAWNEATMTELADHIEQTHHAFTREALTRLANSLPRVVGAHGERHPELRRLEEVVREFSAEMIDHMEREERVLFPWLRRLEREPGAPGVPAGSVRGPIDCMEHDHESAGAALAEMRRLTGGFVPPPEACGLYRSVLATLREVERDTHVHVHKENNILFPAGLRAEARAGEPRSGCGCAAPGGGGCSRP